MGVRREPVNRNNTRKKWYIEKYVELIEEINFKI